MREGCHLNAHTASGAEAAQWAGRPRTTQQQRRKPKPSWLSILRPTRKSGFPVVKWEPPCFLHRVAVSVNKGCVCVHTQFLKEDWTVLAYSWCTVNGNYDLLTPINSALTSCLTLQWAPEMQKHTRHTLARSPAESSK